MSSTDLVKVVNVVEEVVVEVNTSGVVREVPSTFLSVALGSRLIQYGWMTFNTRWVHILQADDHVGRDNVCKPGPEGHP